jgi:hypothetical protein
MELEKKVEELKWTKPEVLECWARFVDLYTRPRHHGLACFRAQIEGNTDRYIEREVKTFDRYAKHWRHVRGLHPANMDGWEVKFQGSPAHDINYKNWTAQ